MRRFPASVDFRRYFFADLISSFGTGMHLVAMGWFLLKTTGTSQAVGGVWAVAFASGLLALPVAGTIVDKLNRRNALILSNWSRAFCTAAVALTLVGGVFETWMLYATAFLNGLGWYLYLPASRAFVQEVLAEDELLAGNAAAEVAKQAGIFLSAIVAGYLYELVGFGAVLLIDAGTYLVANLFLYRVVPSQFQAADSGSPFRERLRNGWGFLRERKALAVFGVLVFLPHVATMTINVVAPGYVEHYLQRGPVVYGIFDGAYGLGALLAGFAAAPLVTAFGRRGSIFGLLVLSILTFASLGVAKLVVVAYAIALILGLLNNSLRVVFQTMLMEAVDKDFMGRAMSVWMLAANFCYLAVFLGYGALADAIPVEWAFAAVSLIVLPALVGVWLLRHRLPASLWQTRAI